MSRLGRLPARLPTFDTRPLPPPPKTADPYYATSEHQAWRDAVIARAGGRCEQLVDGRRCPRSALRHRLFADHIRELRDGGAPLDVANGRCLCAAHHSAKTAAARAIRRSS